jgi:hypothetical protein
VTSLEPGVLGENGRLVRVRVAGDEGSFGDGALHPWHSACDLGGVGRGELVDDAVEACRGEGADIEVSGTDLVEERPGAYPGEGLQRAVRVGLALYEVIED